MSKLAFYVPQSIWQKVALSHSSDVNTSADSRWTSPDTSQSNPKCRKSFDSGTYSSTLHLCPDSGFTIYSVATSIETTRSEQEARSQKRWHSNLQHRTMGSEDNKVDDLQDGYRISIPVFHYKHEITPYLKEVELITSILCLFSKGKTE